jgi:hypothetical protein
MIGTGGRKKLKSASWMCYVVTGLPSTGLNLLLLMYAQYSPILDIENIKQASLAQQNGFSFAFFWTRYRGGWQKAQPKINHRPLAGYHKK